MFSVTWLRLASTYAFYLRNVFDVRAAFLEKIHSYAPVLPFFILFIRSCLILSSGHSHLKTSRPNQTSYHHRNTPLHVEKMVYITKLQAKREPMHVIKWLDIYSTCQKWKNKWKYISLNWNKLFSFFCIWPLPTIMYTFQASNLRNRSLKIL